MPTQSRPIIVAYDGTPNADAAVLLGRELADAAGARLAIAHVYRAAPHNLSAPSRAGHEQFLSRRAAQLTAHGARAAGAVDHLAIGATTTATGIRTLAEREHAALVVFGSAFNTEPGHVHPGSAARRLLQTGPCAVAFAPVAYHEHDRHELNRIAVACDDDAASASRSAVALARAMGGDVDVVESEAERDLVFIGSRPGAAIGRVMTSASAERVIQSARCPVVVVARGEPAIATGGGAAQAA